MTDRMDTEICYGALFDAFAKPCGNQNLMRHTATQTTSLFSTFSLTEGTKGIFSLSYEQTQLAVVDLRITSKLVALRQISGVRCEAVVPTGNILKRKAKSSSPFQTSINIFGPRRAADEVSAALSKVNAFLQHPETLHDGVEYYNPDMLILPGQRTSMNHHISTSQSLLEESKVSRDVRGVLESLDQVAESDEWCHLAGLVTSLTQHQQQGVRFVLQREDESMCRGLAAHVAHITGAEPCMQADNRPFGLGGLIADVMGIGKTLTILASILHSANAARDFSYFGHIVPGGEPGSSPTKATLVVVPSVQLMENWESEISTHFSMNSLQHVRFHGPNRPQTVDALTAPDIVVTTYATLAADHDSRGILYRMHWYRVVLDEAHHVRNSVSKQWKAAKTLWTTRRWCLSGTPIQNKIEDLSSLAGFLQLPPLGSKDLFEKYVLRPLSDPSTNSGPLKAYMQAYCLRRSESCLSLPASRDEIVPLYLSRLEREAYDAVLQNCRKQIDDMRSPSPLSGLASGLEDVTVSTQGKGFSTKLEAVAARLVSASKSGSKSIVFSYWKNTLHLLARILRATSVTYLQVDGDTSFIDRSSRLRAFKDDSNANVLLMTVETGAVGLNLTVANQVHIMEPQWNPSVEEQAVARAVRMGQKREVTIYLNVLQNAIEQVNCLEAELRAICYSTFQNIVKLQEKKRRLARYTLGVKSDQSISEAVQELESVLELNPLKRGLNE